MKKLHYLTIASLLFFASCIKDETTTLDGTWSCSETSVVYGSTNPYEVNITTDASNENKIYLENFYDLGYNNKVTATLSGDNISISSQTIDGYTISGSGTKNSESSLSFTYYSYDGADHDTITSTYTKK